MNIAKNHWVTFKCTVINISLHNYYHCATPAGTNQSSLIPANPIGLHNKIAWESSTITNPEQSDPCESSQIPTNPVGLHTKHNKIVYEINTFANPAQINPCEFPTGHHTKHNKIAYE